jgi:hypothetical protein
VLGDCVRTVLGVVEQHRCAGKPLEDLQIDVVCEVRCTKWSVDVVSGIAFAKPTYDMWRTLLFIILCWPNIFMHVAVADEPSSLRELHRVALGYAGLHRDAPVQWSRRAKWAAALPRLQIGGRHTFRDNFDVKLSDAVSVSGTGVVIGPRSSNLTEGNDRNIQLEVKALWQLNELIFSPDQIHISREARERRKERRQLLREVNHWYFQWRASATKRKRARAVAELDALTGGWFSAKAEKGD